ncbi:hypothetical protein L7F22_047988 [Adiantum nelumboides]|nr:hypothetical protein [Adiantum nelumboides]
MSVLAGACGEGEESLVAVAQRHEDGGEEAAQAGGRGGGGWPLPSSGCCCWASPPRSCCCWCRRSWCVVVFIFGNTCKTVFEGPGLPLRHASLRRRRSLSGRWQPGGGGGDEYFVDGVHAQRWREDLVPQLAAGHQVYLNYHCTPDMGDSFLFCIDSCTPADKLSALKDRIAKYIAAKSNHWSRDFNLVVKEIENNNKMKVELLLNHTINYNAPGNERQIRRSELILEMQKMLQELEFAYHLPVQEVRLKDGVPS